VLKSKKIKLEINEKNYSTSCGGTLNVVVLKSTLTILSTHGRIKNKPGPFAPPELMEKEKFPRCLISFLPCKIRPRRKITAR
jgi:hypothetical protein